MMRRGTDKGGRWRYRVSGIVRLAASRVKYRIIAGGARQTLLSVLGIALAITLMLVVTSVGLGLAAQGTLQAQATDFWLVPQGGASSPVTQVDAVEFGRTHRVTDRLSNHNGVAYATPVLIEIIPFRSDEGHTKRVFLIGLIPDDEERTVLGLQTSALQTGDPYYNTGGYNGTWTGQAIVSKSGAQALAVGEHARISPATRRGANRSFVVHDVQRAQAPGVSQLPVVMVHLSEAQVITGDMTGDRADRILVDVTDPSLKPELATVYPEARVISQQEMLADKFRTSDLPLAMSLAAVTVAIVVGLLTIVTTVGFEFVDDAETRALLAALGFAGRTRAFMLCTETLSTAILGGFLGVVGWLLSVVIINAVGRYVVAVPLAVIRPELAVFGVAVSVGIGLVSLPVLFALTRNTTVMEALPAR